MIVNVVSFNRQHLLDLTCGLCLNGVDVKFYTAVPSWRCKQFGLLPKHVNSLFFYLLPFIIWTKIFRKSNSLLPHKLFTKLVMRKMRKCDAVIINGYSPFFTAEVYREIKSKYKAKIIMEWGSKHIIEERKAINGIDTYPKDYYNLNFECYKEADFISIPSKHVEESFVKHGFDTQKLFLNPYGANCNIFTPTKLNEQSYDLIMVGGWSYRKGVDYITSLCKEFNYSFLHVGGLVDMEFPSLPNMKHIDAVDEKQLPYYYAKAKVFILPSRTEGLALVLAQAIACGLPIVCSNNTGGIDLANLLNIQNSVFEFSEYKLSIIKECIDHALSLANKQKGFRVLSNNINEKLSWKRYGKTYSDFLKTLCTE